MTSEQSVSLESIDGALVIRGAGFASAQSWQVQALGRQRFLIESESAAGLTKGSAAGAGRLEWKVLASLLIGLVEQGFDGLVTLDLGSCVKRLYFKNGELVFAASNLIDDRLGEVIYRAGQITLDQLTEAAVQVNRTTKFGRVLLSNQVFTSSQLWDALKRQVLSIFQSIFLYDHAYVQVEFGRQQSSTAVVLGESTRTLIDDYQGYAELYRQFKLRLNSRCKLYRVESVCRRLGAKPGTFRGDMVELLNAHPDVDDFIAHSKLTECNTLTALFDLVHNHVIKPENYDINTRGLDAGSAIRTLKSLIDAYHQVVESARKAFLAENVEFPVLDIELFLDQQYTMKRLPIFVLQDGSIAPEAVVSIYAMARTSARQADLMAQHVQGLILFVLQVVGDSLPGGKGWDLKRSLQNMVT